ncbi:MAG TPA: twin transmembrane helix small protein [Gammaproteobacteria bacterium]|nr:twin transmembrane helix small protein [Gammaproteobacteria bacterium]
MRFLVVVAFFGIILALGSALLELLRKPEDRIGRKSMANSLTWRIGLSIALFLFVMFAYQMGWIEPHNVAQ